MNILQTQWGQDTSVDISQELDMQRVIKRGETHIPTLLPGTRFYISNRDTHDVSRVLTGLEMLRLQCYPVSDEQYQKADLVDSLYADLAGNAFSGNVLGVPASSIWRCVLWRDRADVAEDDLLAQVMGTLGSYT